MNSISVEPFFALESVAEAISAASSSPKEIVSRMVVHQKERLTSLFYADSSIQEVSGHS